MLGLINGLLGVALLIAGRRIFWVFISALGFITGIQLANNFWQGPEWLIIIIGLISGLLFAFLAVSLQAIAIGVAGFLAGGYVLTILASMLGLNEGIWFWVIYVIGGIIGLLMIRFLFDWTIITLSSFAGASLIINSFFSESGFTRRAFIILFLAGIIIQGYLLRNEQNRESGP